MVIGFLTVVLVGVICAVAGFVAGVLFSRKHQVG